MEESAVDLVFFRNDLVLHTGVAPQNSPESAEKTPTAPHLYRPANSRFTRQ